MLAGQYMISNALASVPACLAISSTDGRNRLFVLSHGAQATDQQDESKLVFHRYGEKYFLSQIWTGGGTDGRELPTSRTERQWMKASTDQGQINLATR